MSIQEVGERIKGLVLDERIFLSVLLAAVSVSSFMVGRYSVESISGSRQSGVALIASSDTSEHTFATTSEPLSKATEKSNEQGNSASVLISGASAAEADGGTYVASKKGKKYHLPWCSGGKAISEENKIWFSTKDEAEAAGYEPAKNCKGI